MRLVTLDDATDADGQPLFVEFVNTLHWYEGLPVELIGTDADFAAWLTEHALPTYDVTGELPDVHVLREHVRAVIVALVNRRALPDADLAAVHAALAAPTGSLALVDAEGARPHLSFATHASDARLFGFRVALSLALFLDSPYRPRLKLCANPSCGFAFVDTSTNATRRWCDMRYCGNRLKVRAYRRRQVPAHLAQPG
jgi:predicted RNA-binding Zn ribbon-like protein